MARHAAEAVLTLARILDLPDGMGLHLVGEDQGMVVAAAAPERGLDADRVLHVLDGFPIPLVVEGSHVVHGTLPLIVNIRVTGPAGLGIHEELRGNGLAVGGGRGTGKEQAGRTAPFTLHA